MAGDELSDREKHMLSFLESQQDKMTRLLNKAYQNGKEISKIDETQRKLKKIMPAKLALAQLIRAVKKRDYMLLHSDAVPEIDQVKVVVPDVVQFAEEIREMRMLQKSIFSMSLRRDSPELERPLFTLPQLPTNRGMQHQSIKQSMEGISEIRRHKKNMTAISQDSPLNETSRQSYEQVKHQDILGLTHSSQDKNHILS